MDEELKQLLEDISSKLDELSKCNIGKEEMGTEDKETASKKIANIKDRISDLKEYIDDKRKGAVETKMDIENKIKESPLTYLVSAFAIGWIIGRITKKDQPSSNN